jgi:hypothetical protein
MICMNAYTNHHNSQMMKTKTNKKLSLNKTTVLQLETGIAEKKAGFRPEGKEAEMIWGITGSCFCSLPRQCGSVTL